VTTTELLARLRELGITIRAEGGALNVNAPAGALTLELRTAITQHKAEIIDLLSQSGGQRSSARIAPRISGEGPRRGPLALPQQRMWFFERAQPGTSVMNISVAMRLHGEIDPDKLTQALALLARRHEALRTRIEDGGNGPEQVIELDPPLPFRQTDVSHLDASHSESRKRTARDRRGGRG
jgi:hypothetical protein